MTGTYTRVDGRTPVTTTSTAEPSESPLNKGGESAPLNPATALASTTTKIASTSDGKGTTPKTYPKDDQKRRSTTTTSATMTNGSPSRALQGQTSRLPISPTSAPGDGGLNSFHDLTQALNDSYPPVHHFGSSIQQRANGSLASQSARSDTATATMSSPPWPRVAGATYFGGSNDGASTAGPAGDWLTAPPMSQSASKSGKRTGTTKFFNVLKGFGFILDHHAEELGGDEVFVHYSAIEAVQSGRGGFRSLQEGEQVEYSIVRGPKGWQAQDVTGPDGSPCIGSPPNSASKSAAPQELSDQNSLGGVRRLQPRFASSSGTFLPQMNPYANPQYAGMLSDPRYPNTFAGPYSQRTPFPPMAMMTQAGPYGMGSPGYQIIGLPPHTQPSSGSDTQVLINPSGGEGSGNPGFAPQSQPMYFTTYPAFDTNMGPMVYYHPPQGYHSPADSNQPLPPMMQRRESNFSSPPNDGRGGPPSQTSESGGLVYPIGPGTIYTSPEARHLPASTSRSSTPKELKK